MKIYISGRISGLPYEEVLAKFAKAEKYLTDLGYEVVNPLRNGLSKESNWQDHMVADIALLFQCEAIFLLSDWLDSKGAMIEKNIAQITDLKIYYETKMAEDFRSCEKTEMILFRVEAAIQEVTGLALEEYAVSSRDRGKYFARLIFSYQCFTQGVKNKSYIGEILRKDHTTPLRALKKYPDELKYNPEFRDIAERVNRILTRVRVSSS